MVVREKRSEVAILRTLGSAPRNVLGIFMAQGTLIGCIGTALGVFIGVLVSINLARIVGFVERVLGMKFLAPEVYFISEFPSRLLWSDVTTIAAVALLLAVCSTIYPAWRGSAMAPAQALRYN
jgi:lipoprotein-releasing system permease protein